MDYPKELLTDVSWTFGLGAFGSESEFENELKEYHDEVKGETLDTNTAILECTKVIIIYEVYDDDEEDFLEKELTLEPDNGSSFKLKELLYKINEEIAPELEDQDKRFLEGLFFESSNDPAYPDTPIYNLFLGS